MTDPILWLVVALLVAGVLASIVPVVPGSLFSLLGLVVYAIGVGLDDLGAFWFLLLLLFVLIGVVFDVVASVVSSRMGGASTRTALLGIAVGVLLIFTPLGPLGLVVGLAGTVFVVQYRRTEDVEGSLRAAVYATVGILASKVVQILLNAIVLVVFLWRVGFPAVPW